MTAPARIGIYGGTFDPPHNAHLEIARSALREKGLDKIVFVVSARPPHKENDTGATAEQRLAMVEAALASESNMEASNIEIQREGPSYTRETLDEMAFLYPEAKLYLILGLDSLMDLPGWKEPEAVMKKARLIVVPRPGAAASIPPQFAGKFEWIRFSENPLSSTMIRRRLATQAPVNDLVPPAVKKVIEEKELYRGIVSDTAGE